MKKLTLIMLIFVSAFISHAQQRIELDAERNGMQITANSGQTFDAYYSFKELTLQQIHTPKGVFAEMSAPGFTFRYNDGNPSVPVFANLIEIPGDVNANIIIKSFTTETITLSDYGIYDKLIPAQPSWSKSTDPSDIEFMMNEAAYQVNDFTQGPLVSIEFQGMARGVGIAQLVIDPVRYNPVTNQLLVYNNIEFEVEYLTTTYSQYFEEKDRVYSPLFNSTYNKLPNYIPATTRDLITQYPIKYVIVSHHMFRDSLQQFVHWKTQKGFNVVEAYTDDPAVGTTTTSIKNYLLNMYNAGTPSDPPQTFVLVVGDVAQVPAFSGSATVSSHVSDMYYVEYTGGSDFIPEAYFGRFSATTVAQLMPQIEKTLQYEKFTMPDPAYMDTVVLVAGHDSNFEYTHGNTHINYASNNYFNSSNDIYAWTYLAPNNTNAIAGGPMREKLYKGLGFANYTAHCGSTGWGEPQFLNSHVPSMNNKDRYGFLIGNCCQSNKFDDAACLGETLLRTPNKGAVGYIGGSNNTHWNEDFWWGVGTTSSPIPTTPTYANTALGALDCLFHSNNEPYADWFVSNGQVVYAGNKSIQASTSGQKRYYWEIYHLMGDPSVMTYLWNPDPLVMTYNEPIMVGDNSLVVNCEPYTLVALSQNNVLLDAKFSGPSSTVTLEFTPFTDDGTALIVGTKQNRAPHIEEIDVEDISVPVDAQVMYIQNVESHYTCVNMNIHPKIVLRNKGMNNLTQVTLNHSWNGAPAQQMSWNGNLSTLDTVHISLPSYLVTSGNHGLLVYTTNPNGTTDGNLSNDTMQVSFLAEDLPVMADFATSITEFCSPPASVSFVNNSANAQSYIWDFGDGNGSATTNPTHVYAANGVYSVSLIADAGICGIDQKTITNMILVGAEPPVASNAENCGPVSFVLNATAQQDVLWYSDAAGTNLIHTGNTYTTPLLSSSTTYYLGTSIENSFFGAKTSNSTTGGYFTSSNALGLVFSCSSPVVLKSVKMYSGATTTQNRTIRLESSSDALIQSVTVSVPPGESRVTLDLNIPVGTNMKLMGPGTPNLWRDGPMTIAYPFSIGGNAIQIHQSTAQGSELNYYYYFYDWEMEQICSSALTEVNAYIHVTPTADFSYNHNGSIIQFTNLSTDGGGASYLWDFGDGNTSTLENPTHSYLAPGQFTVTLLVTNSCGNHSSSQQVTSYTSVDENQSQDFITIYPNPVLNTLSIDSEVQISEVMMYDVTGKVVYTYQTHAKHLQIDFSGFAKGIYMLKLIAEEQVMMKKIIHE
jgi:PKD repeat protein